MHTISRLVLWGCIFYLVYLCFMFLIQRRLLFPRSLIPTAIQAHEDVPDLEKFWLDTASGKVEAWFLPPVSSAEKGPAPAVIFAHGNAELIDFWPRELNAFAQLGMGVLLVEYPGYGRSEGTPSQESITSAFVTAYDMLVSREDVDASRIVLFGRSLGGGAVCALAAERPSAALILLSAFTSVRAFAPRFLSPGFVVRDPFDNLAVVQAYTGPVLVGHGTRDQVVPYAHGEALYRASKHGKMLTYTSGHNDCPPSWEAFRREVKVFLHDAGILEAANK